jgi:hemerythrin
MGQVATPQRALIEWTDELSVGIQEIDEQHKVLVGLVNEMHRAIHEHHGSETARQILDRLGDYTRIHFAVEESLMRIFDYPGYDEHKKQHEELIAQFRSYQAKVASGTAKISFELLHFLKLWLAQHILESDKEYAPHMLKLGAKAKSGQSSWFGRLWHH